MHNSAILGQVMEEGIFDLGDSEAEISRPREAGKPEPIGPPQMASFSI
jgi:hypothetical protein